jgi:hypothetical protein
MIKAQSKLDRASFGAHGPIHRAGMKTFPQYHIRALSASTRHRSCKSACIGLLYSENILVKQRLSESVPQK